MARRTALIPKTALSARKRRALPASAFAVPSERKYPINDLFHARLALTYVLSPSNAEYRDEVVRAVLAKYPELRFWWESRSKRLAAAARRRIAARKVANPRMRRNGDEEWMDEDDLLHQKQRKAAQELFRSIGPNVGSNADWYDPAYHLGGDLFLVDSENGTLDLVRRGPWNADEERYDDETVARFYTADEAAAYLKKHGIRKNPRRMENPVSNLDVVRKAISAAYKKSWGDNISASTLRDAVKAPKDTKRRNEEGIVGSRAVVFTEYGGLSQYDNHEFWSELKRELRLHGLYYEWLDGGTATIRPINTRKTANPSSPSYEDYMATYVMPARRRLRRNSLSEDGMIVQSNPRRRAAARRSNPFSGDADLHRAEQLLGRNVGLNSDWSSVVFYVAPRNGKPNLTSGAIYLFDTEENGRWALLQRVTDLDEDIDDIHTLKEFKSLKTALDYIESHRDVLEQKARQKANPSRKGGANPRRRAAARRNPAHRAVDAHAARELLLYIENEYTLVGAPNSMGKAIRKQLATKMVRGKYDSALAWKAWMYLADEGARRYTREFDSRSGFGAFDKPTREAVAHDLAERFDAEIHAGEYDAKEIVAGRQNPRRRAPARRRNGLSEDGMIVQSNPRVWRVSFSHVQGPAHESRLRGIVARWGGRLRVSGGDHVATFSSEDDAKHAVRQAGDWGFGGQVREGMKKNPGHRAAARHNPRAKKPTRLEQLQADAARAGYLVDAYSPGDGVTRYRFFKLSDLERHGIDPREQNYFGPASGVHTALGLAAANTFLAGARANPRRRNPDPFGRGSANIPVAARFGTGIAGPIVIGGPPVLAPVPDRPIIMSPVDLGGKGGGGGTSGGGSAPGGTASGGGGGSTGTSAPAARANPRRKSARSRAAQSDAKSAMDLFHSGEAKTLAAAWKMVKKGI